MAETCPTVVEVSVWVAPERADLVAGVLQQMLPRIAVIGVGGPRCAAVDQLARQWGVAADDDLRRLVIQRPAAYLLLADPQGVPLAPLAQAAGAGATVLALEPIAAGTHDLEAAPHAPGPGAPGWLRRVAHLPALAAAPGWWHAADPAQALNPVRSIAAIHLGPAGEASLFARLFDAWDAVLHFTDIPETIAASLAGPLTHLPDSVRKLTGWLAAHGRCADGRSVVLQVCDRAGRGDRDLRVLGDGGQWHMTDLAYTLHDPAGQLLDSWAATDLADSAAARVVEQWTTLLDRPAADAAAGPDPASALGQTLACCAACLLSCRTGQPESPAKLQALGRRG
jgi:hypothetical protein